MKKNRDGRKKVMKFAKLKNEAKMSVLTRFVVRTPDMSGLSIPFLLWFRRVFDH